MFEPSPVVIAALALFGDSGTGSSSVASHSPNHVRERFVHWRLSQGDVGFSAPWGCLGSASVVYMQLTSSSSRRTTGLPEILSIFSRRQLTSLGDPCAGLSGSGTGSRRSRPAFLL